MIEIHVSLALNLLDGFTGKALKRPQVRLTLDGEAARVTVKEGGWFVLTDLAPGAHTLRVEGTGFQTERMEVAGGDACRECTLRLKPDASYRFGRRVTTLQARLLDGKGRPAAGKALYLVDPREEHSLRLAQDDATPGSQQLRLFTASRLPALPIPGPFYLEDGGEGEMLALSPAREGAVFPLETPLLRAHRRGCVLRAAIAYTADESGAVFLALPDKAQAVLLTRDGAGDLRAHSVSLELHKHNEVTLTL